MTSPSLADRPEAADDVPGYVVPSRFDARTALDMLAVILLLAGLVGLGFAAHHVSPWLLLTYLSTVAIATGIALGMDR